MEVLEGIKGSRYADELNLPLQRVILGELPYMDYDETLDWYHDTLKRLVEDHPEEDCRRAEALLGCNDRYFLLTHLLHRVDLLHPWLFDRCREVEADPDGHIDLWARYHAKTSIISTGGVIQEIMRDPNITVAIFSATKALAQEILGQIKNEFENNEHLKDVYPDVLYENPRGIDPRTDERPAKWSLARGITVKRTQRPKEATIEAHGLLDGQPTGRHFHMHVYDDVVDQDHLAEEQIKKTTARFEMADNLGTRHGVRKQIVGTRYHHGDTYGVIIERGAAKPRIYPATEDGTLNGQLVLLDPENWERVKKTQGMKTVSAQMLLNPLAGNEATFRSIWLQSYQVLPRSMNVYILVDPSKGAGSRSDRTGIAVIGVDPGGVKYLLDGVCHRMQLTERLQWVLQYKGYYENMNGVQTVRVGWERYGMSVELEVINNLLLPKDKKFPIEELNTPRQGGHSKNDRIERLEPDMRAGRFYLPCIVHHWEFGDKRGEFAGQCYWSVWTDENAEAAKKRKETVKYHVGQIIFRPVRGLTKMQRDYAGPGRYRIAKPLKQKDENNDIYDCTRVFMEELIRHPFAAHDDFIDAVSRIYDIDPQSPVPYDAKSTESIYADDSEIDQAAPEDDEGPD